MRVDYLRLAGGSELIAVAIILKLGRTIGAVDVRINDDQQRLVAIGRAAYVTMSVCGGRGEAFDLYVLQQLLDTLWHDRKERD